MNEKIKKSGEILAGLALVAAVGLWLLHDSYAGPQAVASGRKIEIPIVTARALTSQKIVRQVEAIGTAAANEAITITAHVQERVVKADFAEGGVVERGAPIVELYRDKETSALKQAEITLAEERREWERSDRLREQHAIAVKDTDTQKSKLDRAEMAVEIARSHLADRLIVAPFAGILGRRMVSVGELVAPGETITTLDQIDLIKVDFHLPEKYFSAVRPDLTFTARPAAYPDREFTGKITVVSPRVNPDTRNVEMRGVLENSEENGRWLLYPGMLLAVSLRLSDTEIVSAPEAAILSIGERHYLFVYDAATKKVERRAVELGERERGAVEILRGAQIGEMIIVDGIVKLSDGMTVSAQIITDENSEKIP